jgi:lipoyl-dependent peroxiredoxin
MAQRNAKAVWRKNLKQGTGTMELGSGGLRGDYTFQSRFESGPGTNPEELIGAALAGCFSMFLAGEIEKAGYSPETVETSATVSLEPVQGDQTISRILLDTRVTAPDIEEGDFQRLAEASKRNCPVSRALAATQIDLKATLVSRAGEFAAR